MVTTVKAKKSKPAAETTTKVPKKAATARKTASAPRKASAPKPAPPSAAPKPALPTAAELFASASSAAVAAAERQTIIRPATVAMVASLAKQLQGWAGTVLGNVGAATDLSLWIAKNKAEGPLAKAALSKTQSLLRDLRETAGLTRDDLSKALDLEDRSFMEMVESGRVTALPFDLILRLAAVLGRSDPLTLILQMTRVYNPKMWKTLESLGIGKLFIQAGREREFANIYRSHDAARELSDADFATALTFTNAAFEAALAFQAKTKKPGRPKEATTNAPIKPDNTNTNTNFDSD